MAHRYIFYTERKNPIDFPIHYFAGICVTAVKFEIPVKSVSIGDETGLDGAVLLQPSGRWCDLNVGMNPFKAARVEDYATTLLAGTAAVYIRVLNRRCHLKRTLGDAGLEMRFLRQVWQSLRREPDRAVALICGSLGAFDDGDVEATTKRLWHRAVRILSQPQHDKQVKALARELTEQKQMTGQEVVEFLRRHSRS